MNINRAVEASMQDQMSTGEIVGAFAITAVLLIVFTVIIIWAAIAVTRDPKATKAVNRNWHNANAPLRGFGKLFKDGYDNGRNRALGALAFLVPTASAVDVETKFSDGVGQVLEGIWLIILPYASVAFVLFLIIIALKKLAGRSR
ncbi:hypothetical protein AHiyo8_59510 [Arthrobacter sp. Hiyo8]|uniref:hypothetical protein n=1 Tax=Arthrobacter sp. Hiyo1 TaxID=1588020 RepID=UPI0006838289|nr:hypothetical protein [Arthrobacter sp. Hiyo1]BAS17648.1 hypothetical protein AHiyo8_59510 [Arthrobacter sp. Hiyo8]GAP58004.1 hypothetical protein AHiyo1_09660 [Arthrobacter sp. Hiyo1]